MTRFVDFLEQNTLPVSVIEAAHSWLLDHMGQKGTMLPLRATGSVMILGVDVPARRHRGQRLRLAVAERDAVFCDNELPVWLYGRAPTPGFFNVSLQAMLEQRLAPVADTRARNEGDGTFRLETVARPWGAAKRHKHIFDAGLPRGTDNSALTSDEAISKFLRFVHPVNWFLFPADLAHDAEQNDAPEYQHVAAVWLERRCQDVFREFLTLIRPDGFGWNSQWRTIGQRCIDTLLMPERNVERPSGGSKPAAKITVSTPVHNAHIVEVNETRSGRFHLSGFGVSAGGVTRDTPIAFRVIGRSGRVLLQSHPTTAASLGIAGRGREDYDANGFRQSDLVVRDPSTGVLTPNSAIGRRIPWIIRLGHRNP